MLIRNRPSWELPEGIVTPEHLVMNRRGLLRTAGAFAAAGIIAGCDRNTAQNVTSDPAKIAAANTPDPSASLYPVKTNDAFKSADREITAEQLVTSYNNYYEFGVDKSDPVRNADALPIRPWEISIEGMVEAPIKTDFDTLLKAMPLEERVYRHRCVETWSYAAPWSGFPMKALIEYAKPMSGAKYVVMKSFMNPDAAPAQGPQSLIYGTPWPYTEGLTIAEASNDLAFMVTGAYGKPLPKQNGAPLRLATPWKYGFKSTKGIQRFIFTIERPKTYWMALGPDEYGFWANVNPNVPHPRWSQSSEEILGTGMRVPTKLYNGYGEHVSGLYANLQDEHLFM